MKKGKLYGVSVGPGDPEHMTLKALRCLERVPVIAAPRTRGKNCRALDTVRANMDVSGKEILYLDFAMKKDADILDSTHRQQADAIEVYLAQGKDVAMLNIGDASLFGTFCYVRELVEADGYESSTIAGVTSFCAVAAELGQSLTNMGDPLVIIPGSFENVSEELDHPGTKVLMKSASALGQVKQLLIDKGLAEKSAMIADCGLPNQRIFRNIRESSDNEGYFVTILVQSHD